VACFTGAAQAVTFLNHAPLLPLVMADLAVTPAEAGLLSTVMFAVGRSLPRSRAGSSTASARRAS
jgi:hypothetical protein